MNMMESRGILIQEAINAPQTSARLWQICLNLSTNTLRQGIYPVSFIYYLSGMGEIKTITTHRDQLLRLAQLDAEQCYLNFSIQLLSHASQHELEQALEFLIDGNDISVSPGADTNVKENSPVLKNAADKFRTEPVINKTEFVSLQDGGS